jgi:hypothetical protein
MADQNPKTPEPSPQPPSVDDLVRQLQSQPTYAAQKAFYQKHPALRAVFDPCNFTN